MTRTCPKCQSKNVEPDTTSNTVFSHGDISSWICNECGYSGTMPTEAKNTDQEKAVEEVQETEIDKEAENKKEREILYITIMGLVLILIPFLLILLSL